MEVNYQFIAKLKTLLFSQGNEWRAEMDKEAARLEAAKQKLQLKQGDKQPQTVPNLAKHLAGINERLVELQDATKYAWNVEPFRNESDARLLLANIHILEDPALKPLYNLTAVEAIKNMLSERFANLYNDDVNQAVLSIKLSHVEVLKPDTVKSIMIGKIPALSDILTPSLKSPRAENITKKLAKYLSTVDSELLREVTKSLAFISKFYYAGDHVILSFFTPTLLSLCFTNMEDVEIFLARNVDYSSFNDFENSFIQIQRVPEELAPMTTVEKNIWSKIIAHNGKQAMGLFFRSEQLSKTLDKTIEEIYDESSGDATKAFEQLQTMAMAAGYENVTSDTKELAKIASKYNISQEVFNRIATEILPYVKDHDDLPNIEFDIEYKGQTLHFSKLPAGDLRGLFLGHMTGCCQSIGGDSEQTVQDAFTRTDASFYVLTDSSGKVKAQSLAWIGQNEKGERVLVLDSFEHNKDVSSIYVPLMKEILKNLQSQSSDFTELYIGTGGQTPNTQAEQKYGIQSPEGFHRYRDSKKTYKIEDTIKLAEKHKYHPNEYSDFNQYFKAHLPIAFTKLYYEHYEVAKQIYLMRLPLLEANAITLLMENPRVSEFIVTHMRTDEVSHKPEPNSILKSNKLPSYWHVVASGDIRYTAFHKLSMLKTLIDCNYALDQILETLNHYANHYNFDPQLLEVIGYENITRLPYNFDNLWVMKGTSWDQKACSIRDTIRALKKLEPATAKTTFKQVIKEFELACNPTMEYKVSEALKAVKFTIIEDQAVQKAIVTYYLSTYFGNEIGRLGYLINQIEAWIPSFIIHNAPVGKIFAFLNEDGRCYDIKQFVQYISDKKLLEIFEEAADAEKPTLFPALKDLGSTIPDKAFFYKLAEAIPAKEFVGYFTPGYHTNFPPHILAAARSSSEYIHSLSSVALSEFIKFIEPMESEVQRSVIEMLGKLDKESIDGVGIDNLVHLCSQKVLLILPRDKVALLKQELQDVNIPDDFQAEHEALYHKIHVAQHLTISPGVSFYTDFPILGWYQDVPEAVTCSLGWRENQWVYLVGNTGSESVTLDHV